MQIDNLCGDAELLDSRQKQFNRGHAEKFYIPPHATENREQISHGQNTINEIKSRHNRIE